MAASSWRPDRTSLRARRLGPARSPPSNTPRGARSPAGYVSPPGDGNSPSRCSTSGSSTPGGARTSWLWRPPRGLDRLHLHGGAHPRQAEGPRRPAGGAPGGHLHPQAGVPAALCGPQAEGVCRGPARRPRPSGHPSRLRKNGVSWRWEGCWRDRTVAEQRVVGWCDGLWRAPASGPVT